MVINITVKNRVATYAEGDTRPVCGNGGDTVRFGFDEEWAGRDPKTARFIWSNRFHEEVFTGDTCPCPAFLNAKSVQIGVLVGQAGSAEALSTTRATVALEPSIRCGTADPAPIDVEAYTVEAREAAREAQAAAAALAGMGETLAEHDARITRIEGYLGQGNEVREIAGGLDSIDVPARSARYAKLCELGSDCMMNFWSDGYFGQGVTGIRVLNANGETLRSYALATEALADWGWAKFAERDDAFYYDKEATNYLVFENGRAYYHHNVYSVILLESGAEDYEKRSEGDVEVSRVSFHVILKLASPEVLDVTDALGFDGFVDVSGGTRVVFDKVTEDNEDLISFYKSPYVEMLFEIGF